MSGNKCEMGVGLPKIFGWRNSHYKSQFDQFLVHEIYKIHSLYYVYELYQPPSSSLISSLHSDKKHGILVIDMSEGISLEIRFRDMFHKISRLQLQLEIKVNALQFSRMVQDALFVNHYTMITGSYHSDQVVLKPFGI